MRAADPTYVAVINGVSVRFYASPADGIDAPPWVAFDDLHRAMGQPEQDLAQWEEQLAGNDDTGSVLTDEGPITIVSHVIAYSVTAGLVSARKAPLSLVQHYGVAFSEAIDALLARLPSTEASVRKRVWLRESFDFGNAPRSPDGGKLS